MRRWKVEHLASSRHDQYDDFIRGTVGGLAYYTRWYADLLEQVTDGTSQCILAIDGDRIRGVLPMMQTEGRFGRILNSLPFYGSHGGILSSDRQAESLLLAAYADLISDAQVASSTLVTNPLLKGHGRGVLFNAYDVRTGQLTPLPQDGNVRSKLLAVIDGNRRTEIKKNERMGVQICTGNEAFPFLESQHALSMSERGADPKPHSFFSAVLTTLVEGRHYELYAARLEDQVIAALLVLYSDFAAEYFVPVTAPEYKSLAPMSAILIEAMTEAASKGCQWWNWGGTWPTQDGVYRYKAQWGAQAHDYRYLVQVQSQELWQCSPSELLDAYPGFYVAPFGRLDEAGQEPKDGLSRRWT